MIELDARQLPHDMLVKKFGRPTGPQDMRAFSRVADACTCQTPGMCNRRGACTAGICCAYSIMGYDAHLWNKTYGCLACDYPCEGLRKYIEEVIEND